MNQEIFSFQYIVCLPIRSSTNTIMTMIADEVPYRDISEIKSSVTLGITVSAGYIMYLYTTKNITFKHRSLESGLLIKHTNRHKYDMRKI